MTAGFKSVSTIGNIDHPQLFAQPGLVVPDHQGDVTIKLQNMSDVDIEIPRCTTIGFIENLNNEYFNKISPINQESTQQEFSENLSLPKPLSKEKQEEFLAHANIKIPKEQEQAHRVLLAKHHDVFSTDNNDLGWDNHFEHKITTKDKNPTHRKQFPIPEAHREVLKKQIKDWLSNQADHAIIVHCLWSP
jgi:hypothetical protein